MIYIIEPDNKISMSVSSEQRKAAGIADAEQFGCFQELAQLANAWPATRLKDIWNNLPGVKPVRRFADRATGANRVWQALKTRQPYVTVPIALPAAAPAATNVFPFPVLDSGEILTHRIVKVIWGRKIEIAFTIRDITAYPERPTAPIIEITRLGYGQKAGKTPLASMNKRERPTKWDANRLQGR